MKTAAVSATGWRSTFLGLMEQRSFFVHSEEVTLLPASVSEAHLPDELVTLNQIAAFVNDTKAASVDWTPCFDSLTWVRRVADHGSTAHSVLNFFPQRILRMFNVAVETPTVETVCATLKKFASDYAIAENIYCSVLDTAGLYRSPNEVAFNAAKTHFARGCKSFAARYRCPAMADIGKSI